MMFTLFVGDTTHEVSDAAISFDKSAQLLLKKHITNLSSSTYYTSLADCGSIENLSEVCRQSKEIYYICPLQWSDADTNNISKQQKWTELILHYYCQTIPVHNLPAPTINSWTHNVRKYEKQFWAVGCSITVGLGVNKDQSWPELVSAKLNLPYTSLAYKGSSITWQSDQICRADIRAGDIVFWGVTCNHRLPIIRPDGSLLHLTISKFSTDSYAISTLSPELIDNSTLVYQNILAVRRAYNYCQKIGAHLVPLGLIEDIENIYTQYDVPVFRQLIQWKINHYVDLGTDNEHPGPKQHEIFANEFLLHYKRIYCQS